jgi:hypothetical protein
LRRRYGEGGHWYNYAMAKIVLDLHDIFNKGRSIDAELNRVVSENLGGLPDGVDRK